MNDDETPPGPPKPPSVFDADYERRRADPAQYNAEKQQFRCLHKEADASQCKFFEKPGVGYCAQHDQVANPLSITRHLRSVPSSTTVSLRKKPLVIDAEPPKAGEAPSSNPRKWNVQC